MNELDKALELYEQTFDDSFPMFSMMTKPPDDPGGDGEGAGDE